MLEREFEPEFARQSCESFVTAAGDLAVLAPEATHASIRALMARIADALPRPLPCDVVAVRVDAANAACLPPAGLAPAAALAELCARVQRDGGASARIVRATLNISPGSIGWLSQLRRRELVVDYDPEIAMATSVLDPIVVDVQSGVRLALRACAGDQGTWVSWFFEGVEPDHAASTREVAVTSSVTTIREPDFPEQSDAVPASYDKHAVNVPRMDRLTETSTRTCAVSDYRADLAASAADAYIPAGMALIARSAAHTAAAPGEWVVAIAPHASPRGPRTAALPEREREFTFTTLDPWLAGSLELPAGLPAMTIDEDGFVDERDNSGAWNVALTARCLPRSVDAVDTRDVMGLRTQSTGSLLVAHQKKGSLATATPIVGAPSSVLVELRLLGGAQRDEIAHASCVIRSGGTAFVSAGSERLELFDFDVEVATCSAIEDPRRRRSFQGLVASLRPSVRANGGLELLVDVRARRLDDGATDALLPPYSASHFDLDDAEQLAARELLEAIAGATIDARIGTDLGAGLGLEVHAKLLR